MLRLKQFYLKFLEKDKKSAVEIIFYCFLCFFSWIYWAAITLRNFFYDHNIFGSYHSKAQVISIGNLSWAGSGKTSLVLWLNQKLSAQFKIAILRRGYGQDEGLLLEESCKHVYSGPDRRRLAQKLDSQFELFILDDGFQYRKLKRNLNIVVIAAREFRKNRMLIPANFFREPLCSLKRAEIVVVNYAQELSNRDKVTDEIKKISPKSKLYFSEYRIKRFIDSDLKVFDLSRFKRKKVAAFTAIGYPQGFFNKLKEAGFDLARVITYPDHHELSAAEYNAVETELLAQGIYDLIITAKDKYHLPAERKKLNIVIMEIEMQIEDEKAFLSDIKSQLTRKG